MKLSVIIPVYNTEKYLDRCVSSVVNQTLKEIEIILIDDESPDNCPQKCEDWSKKDKRIKVVHKKNGGLGFARNTGIEMANGEYVTFLDSDDYVSPEAYELAYKEAKAHQLEICYFQHCRFNDNGDIISKAALNEKEYFKGSERVNQFFLDMVGPKPCEKKDIKYSMSSCMGIFKLSLLKDNGVRFLSEKTVASEDLLFHMDLLPHVKAIGCLPNEFYYYYLNPKSLTTSYSDTKRERLLRLINEVELRLKALFEKKQYKDHFYTQILRIYKVIFLYEFLKDCSYREDRKSVV